MTMQPVGPHAGGSASSWYPGSPTCNRAYLLAAVRASLIALLLLIMLVAIVML